MTPGRSEDMVMYVSDSQAEWMGGWVVLEGIGCLRWE